MVYAVDAVARLEATLMDVLAATAMFFAGLYFGLKYVLATAMFAGLYFGLKYVLSLIYPDGTERRLR